jgi:3-dehydroquinate dehydratase type I
MRRFRRGAKPKICLTIVETTVEKAIRAIREANRLADLIELRVDYLKVPALGLLLEAGEKPFIITNRRKGEGGKYRGDEQSRLAILREAVDLGSAFVDVELASEGSSLRELIKNKKRTGLILSSHDFQKTISVGELRGLLDRMIRYRAKVAKIVTLARSWEDNLKVLSLIPYARKRKQAIVAFCMGEKGKMSRIFAPQMGAAWTYASLDRKRASAPGQLTIEETKDIWERLR